MAVSPKLRRLRQQTSSIPRSVTLAFVCDNLDLKTARFDTTRAHLRSMDAVLDKVTDITLQAATKVLVERGTTRENNVLPKVSGDFPARNMRHGLPCRDLA